MVLSFNIRRDKIPVKINLDDHGSFLGPAIIPSNFYGIAAFTTVPEDYQILTIEFKVNFLRPAFGERLVCRSRIIREGLQIIIGESEVFDQRGDEEALVAKALVTLMAVHKDKLSSKA